MDPTLIIFGIRALIRLAREGISAFNQFERDRPALFPDGVSADFRQIDFIRNTFFPDHADLLTGSGTFAKYWSGTAPAAVPGAMEALYIGAVKLFAEDQAKKKQVSPRRGVEIGGAVMIKQWADGKGPVGPIGRMVLTMADIGLEFVGANPSLLGVGGNGEKLLGALATNLSDMIPDDGDAMGPKSQLAERFVGIFLRAGLQTLNDQPGLVVREDHLQQLIRNTLPPIIAALPSGLAEQSRWRDVADALLGPAASAAISTVAANPAAFLGASFDPNRAVGALTQAMLKQAATTGLKQEFTEAGLIGLYQAALGVAAARPELFLGRPGTSADQLASDLFAKVAGTLKTAAPPFNSDLGTALAVDVLDTVKKDGPRFFEKEGPWENTVGTMALQVIDGLKVGLTDPASGGIKSVLSQPQLVALARTFLAQAAKTPGMVAGGSTELQAIVGGVAKAMAEDKNILLAPDDWLAIAGVAAEAAAANPQRLFKINTTTPAGAIGTEVIKDLLSVAAVDLAKGGRKGGGVLFGATLRDAITVALRSAAGNAKATVDNQAALKGLAETLSDLVRTHPEKYGSKEWLFMYQSLIGRVLHGGPMGPLTEADIRKILEARTILEGPVA
jgi:hypothetical protein